jgi:hypothetical protein
MVAHDQERAGDQSRLVVATELVDHELTSSRMVHCASRRMTRVTSTLRDIRS